MRGYLSEKFQTRRNSNFRDITETVIGISAKEIGKLGLPVPEAFPPLFSEKEYIGQLALNRPIFLSNKKFKIPSFEN